MTGYKVNTAIDVKSDIFLDLTNNAKLLWLYLYHEAYDPYEDGEYVFTGVNGIARSLCVYEPSIVNELLSIKALIPVETEG